MGGVSPSFTASILPEASATLSPITLEPMQRLASSSIRLREPGHGAMLSRREGIAPGRGGGGGGGGGAPKTCQHAVMEGSLKAFGRV